MIAPYKASHHCPLWTILYIIIIYIYNIIFNISQSKETPVCIHMHSQLIARFPVACLRMYTVHLIIATLYAFNLLPLMNYKHLNYLDVSALHRSSSPFQSLYTVFYIWLHHTKLATMASIHWKWRQWFSLMLIQPCGEGDKLVGTW